MNSIILYIVFVLFIIIDIICSYLLNLLPQRNHEQQQLQYLHKKQLRDKQPPL